MLKTLFHEQRPHTLLMGRIDEAMKQRHGRMLNACADKVPGHSTHCFLVQGAQHPPQRIEAFQYFRRHFMKLWSGLVLQGK